ncbi:reverse transcriptase domain-containing protein [Tanacetum coccineum]
MKAITTRSGISYNGTQVLPPLSSLPKVVEHETEVTKDTVPPTNNRSTEDVQPPVVQVQPQVPIFEPVVAPKPNPKPSIPYPSRLNDQKICEKANNQIEKFYQIFQDLHFPSLAARMDECLALADLGASINLMPLSVWKKLSLPELTPTCMTLELADRSISRPIAKNDKSLIDKPSEVELKDLSPHLEYTFLEGDDKLSVIIAKDLSVEEKAALMKVLKSHKRAIAWKLSDIKEASKGCEVSNLGLNWGKVPFLVMEGIVWRHKISKNMIGGAFLGLRHERGTLGLYTMSLLKNIPRRDCSGGFSYFKSSNSNIVYTDHSALKYLFAKKYSKERLLRWVLLLQEFKFKVIDTKGAENLAADHLSRLENVLDPKEINEMFPLETLSMHANFDLKTVGDHRKVQLNELNELRDQAYENSLIYKEKTKRIHDSKIKNHVFNVGDRVLLFNSRLKLFSGKLKSYWSGPFTITQAFPYGTVELSQTSGPNFKVNGHRLKHYFGEDVPAMDIPDLQTFPKDQ